MSEGPKLCAYCEADPVQPGRKYCSDHCKDEAARVRKQRGRDGAGETYPEQGDVAAEGLPGEGAFEVFVRDGWEEEEPDQIAPGDIYRVREPGGGMGLDANGYGMWRATAFAEHRAGGEIEVPGEPVPPQWPDLESAPNAPTVKAQDPAHEPAQAGAGAQPQESAELAEIRRLRSLGHTWRDIADLKGGSPKALKDRYQDQLRP